MADEIIVDGIIDAIKELRRIAVCPFCEQTLKFEKADRHVWGGNDRFTLKCESCGFIFSLLKKKKKWELEQVRVVGTY